MRQSGTRRQYVLDPDQGIEQWWLRGNRLIYKASANEVGPRFSVVEMLLEPEAAAPAHVHYETDEAIYVLEGLLRLEVGDDRFETRAGSFAFIATSAAGTGSGPLDPESLGLRKLLARDGASGGRGRTGAATDPTRSFVYAGAWAAVRHRIPSVTMSLRVCPAQAAPQKCGITRTW